MFLCVIKPQVIHQLFKVNCLTKNCLSTIFLTLTGDCSVFTDRDVAMYFACCWTTSKALISMMAG